MRHVLYVLAFLLTAAAANGSEKSPAVAALVKHSTDVIVAEVVRMRFLRNEADGGFMLVLPSKGVRRDMQLKVTQRLKGELKAGRQIPVSFHSYHTFAARPIGDINPLDQFFDWTPNFKKGKTYVFFLRKSKPPSTKEGRIAFTLSDPFLGGSMSNDRLIETIRGMVK